jgi:L-arabinokinase
VYNGLCEGDDLDSEIQDMVQQVIEDYRHADLLIRLPGAIRIPSFDDAMSLVPQTPFNANFPETHLKRKGVANGKTQLPCTSISSVQPPFDQHYIRRIIDVPLVFRKYQQPREHVLDQVGIPRHIYNTHRILLLSFGGQLLGNDGGLKGNPLPPGWICIVCAAPDSVVMPAGFYRAAKDAYVPDLTNACDVLLGKLGYGTCSECIGHNTPFVYVPRPQFIEEHGLLKLMADQGSAVELSREDFEDGHWADAIESASTMTGTCKDPQLRVSHNGGEIAAQSIEKFVLEWNHHKALTATPSSPIYSLEMATTPNDSVGAVVISPQQTTVFVSVDR